MNLKRLDLPFYFYTKECFVDHLFMKDIKLLPNNSIPADEEYLKIHHSNDSTLPLIAPSLDNGWYCRHPYCWFECNDYFYQSSVLEFEHTLRGLSALEFSTRELEVLDTAMLMGADISYHNQPIKEILAARDQALANRTTRQITRLAVKKLGIGVK